MEKINLTEYLLHIFKNFNSNKIAIVDSEHEITYNDLSESIKNFAEYLSDKSFHPGDKVGFLMEDSIEWCIAFFATLYVGGTPVLMSPRAAQKNLCDLISTSNVRFIVTCDLDLNLADLTLHDNTIVIEKHEIFCKDREKNILPYWWHPDESSIWCASSGTSGRGQRFIVHRHKNLFEAIKINIDLYQLTDSTISFSTPKLFFNYGLLNLLSGLMKGCKIILSGKVPAGALVSKIVKTYKVTHLYATPTIFASLIKYDGDIKDFDSVMHIACAGEYLPKYIEQTFCDKYKKPIYNGLGMAEILTWCIGQNKDQYKFGTIGAALPEVKVEIRNEQGDLCKTGEIGELYVKHPSIALMYWNSVQDSLETFANGWFKTRDIVYKDSDNYYTYVCRKDDLIKIHGSYVKVLEIEEEISQHPSVEECIVVSIKNKFDMPELSCKIVCKKNHNITSNDIRNFLSKKLESYKIPKHIYFVETLLKTLTTKKIRNRNHERSHTYS